MAVFFRHLPRFMGRSFSKSLFFIFFVPVLAIAQSPPQTSEVVSALGGSPSASFYAGAQVGEGPFLTSVERASPFQLIIELEPDPVAVGSAGKLYVLAFTNAGAFTLLESGEWVGFDGTIAGLGGAKVISSFDEHNAFAIDHLEDLFVLNAGSVNSGKVELSIFLAYDSSAIPNDVHYTSSPVAFALVDSGLQNDPDLNELINPSTLTGSVTSARFFAEASQGEQVSGNSPVFEIDSGVDVMLGFMPEISHFDSPGRSFVLTIAGGAAFVRQASGGWVAWDGSLGQLLANNAASYSELLSYQQLDTSNIADLVNRSGVQIHNDNVIFQVFVAYETDAAPGQIYYSGVPAQFTIELPNSRDLALTYFQENISDQVVNTRCAACHFEGGPARTTGLIFQRPGPASDLNNFAAFESFVSGESDNVDFVLAKASGGESHGGGVQVPVGSNNYNELTAFFDTLLTGNSQAPVSLSDQFFEGVAYLTNIETLRRATIMLASRAPTQAEIEIVEKGDAESLKTVLRQLMTGDSFHDFLIEGANDRLLVRGSSVTTFLNGGGVWPNFKDRQVELLLKDVTNDVSASLGTVQHHRGVQRGLIESPLELIAHVVENEKPYSEILTADYMMLNPMANFAVDGTAVFNDPDNQSEFRPGRIDNYRLLDGSVEFEYVPEIAITRIVDPGNLAIDFPHAGILNTQSFLARYPTTPTNRNRARARWTFLHFLDIDIEKSAQRTTDPMALADTNNPTLNNPACTVCHVTMDPVAGAFQNYGNEGIYRDQFGGMDALDLNYKIEDGTPYQFGDTWYQGMRIPGLFNQQAPVAGNSVQWLAEQIVQEPGFARAAVKFWWPSVIGAKPLRLPEIEEDLTYDAHLMAYEAQNQTLSELAERFSASGLNLKDMLVEMIVSPWYRATWVDSDGLTPNQLSAHGIAELGNEVLLTPERLARKTKALTGFGWFDSLDYGDQIILRGVSDRFGGYLGGIDSRSTTERAREITPLMFSTAFTHSTQSACPIVLKDFMYVDGERRLFNGLDPLATPVTDEAALRQKLVDLHFTLLGKSYASHSSEIDAAYQLLEETWESRNAENQPTNLRHTSEMFCPWWRDSFYLDDTPYEGEIYSVEYDARDFPTPDYTQEASAWVETQADDPQRMKSAWVTVIVYLLSHYDYLYE